MKRKQFLALMLTMTLMAGSNVTAVTSLAASRAAAISGAAVTSQSQDAGTRAEDQDQEESGDSAALEKACKDNGILFANCDQLAVDYPNLWDPDGIHFRKEFYPYWASCLIATLLMEGA